MIFFINELRFLIFLKTPTLFAREVNEKRRE